jgi:hypothetical protein
MGIFKGIPPLDYVLTIVMAALAVPIGLENVNGTPDVDVAHALDSHSPSCSDLRDRRRGGGAMVLLRSEDLRRSGARTA